MKFISVNDRNTFNSFMTTGPKSHVLQSYEWGEVKQSTGWEPLRFLIEQDGKFVAGVSVLKRTLPIPGKSIFYIPRGPVIDYKDRAALSFMFRNLIEQARKHGAILIKIDPDLPADDIEVRNNLKSLGFVLVGEGLNFEGIQPKFVFRLPLDKPLDDIFAEFTPKTRYNIRLSKRRGVKIIEDCTKDMLKPFYDILKITCERDKFLVRSYEYFESLWDNLVERGLAKLFMAEYEGRFIAGTLAFIFGDKAWYIYGASANEARNVMPNYSLQWHMIKWAKESGCTMYDFRGVSGDLSPDNPLYGLYRFKKGFNGEFTEFMGEMDMPLSRTLYWAWVKGVPMLRKVRRDLVNLKRRLLR
jgi:peptidoglycan pentaglycine glycine transferase (the first glycine)